MWQETNKQWDLKVLVPQSTALHPEGLKLERHFPQQPTARFLYPLLGSPPALAAVTDRAQKRLFTVCAWSLAAFLFSHNGICFLKGSKRCLCPHTNAVSGSSSLAWAVVVSSPLFWFFLLLSSLSSCALTAGLGAASQFPAKTGATWGMQEFFVSLTWHQGKGLSGHAVH